MLLGHLIGALQYPKAEYKKDGETFNQAYSGRTEGKIIFLLRGWVNSGTGCLENCGCFIVGSVQGQVGSSFEQPDVTNVPSHGIRIGLDGLGKSF